MKPAAAPFEHRPEWLQLKRVVTALLAHGFDRDCQGLLVDDVHLLADTQGADEGLDLRVPCGNGSRQVVRPNEAHSIGHRVNVGNGDAAATDTCNLATRPARRLGAIDRHAFKRLARWGATFTT